MHHSDYDFYCEVIRTYMLDHPECSIDSLTRYLSRQWPLPAADPGVHAAIWSFIMHTGPFQQES